jgi:hypothetical protein
MHKFKNIVLQREYIAALQTADSISKGIVCGYSIEIETKEPKSFSSYTYNGKLAEDNREHDFLILEKLFKEKIVN